MATVKLVKWGNSMGIRIPANIIEAAHLKLGEAIKIIVTKNGKITLTPIQNAREGWQEAFNKQRKDNKLLIDIPNDFDKNDWK